MFIMEVSSMGWMHDGNMQLKTYFLYNMQVERLLTITTSSTSSTSLYHIPAHALLIFTCYLSSALPHPFLKILVSYNC